MSTARKVFAVFSAILIMAAAVSAAVRDRYEAQDAEINNYGASQQGEIAENTAASGGQYVIMRDASIYFNVTVEEAGFYTMWVSFSQTYGSPDNPSKTQSLVINGTSVGQIVFPGTGSESSPPVFELIKGAPKIRLNAGSNKIGIVNSWGWVDIDYIEIEPFEETPFNIIPALVTPNPSLNARRMFNFLRQNFQQKVISGVMTGKVMQDDGNRTPFTRTTQPELKFILESSDKLPALVGLDFMHSTGLMPQGDWWFMGYHYSTLALAEEIFNEGGIPIYCWHWKDPNKETEPAAFYTSNTEFDLSKAFSDPGTYAVWNTESDEYKNMIEDIDFVSGALKSLADKDIAVLWRPLHEASGKWFWWGAQGPGPLVALWRMMFDRMVNHHGLDNLIWVWTSDEAPDALEWYPGDNYVDIVGIDYYHGEYPNFDKNHSSLISSFEKLKETYGGRKLIALSENGSIPYPDSMANDGAMWSWFMPWFEEWTWGTNNNIAADWNYIMNHNLIITLDDMPGWDNVTSIDRNINTVHRAIQPSVTARIRYGKVLELNIRDTDVQSVELFNLRGAKIATMSTEMLGDGVHRFAMKGIARQILFVRVTTTGKRVITVPIRF